MAAKITCNDDQIVVELVDNGQPFDPIAHDPTDPPELRVGGVGIRLARHWVDEMRYERRGPHNHVVLVKRRQGGSGRH